jgi:DSF synthase
LLWITIKPEPKPVFTLQLLTSVGKVQRALFDLWGPESRSEESPVKFLAYRAEGPVFTLGGDLDFYLDCLAGNDRRALEEYARTSVEGASWNASGIRGIAITLSTIHAKAIGGGIDAPRSCNVMIAEERASFVYPEVRFNHFPITAVAILSRCMGPVEARRMLMSGDEYGATEFFSRGGVDAVVPSGGGEDWIRAYAAETLPMHAARSALFAAFHHRAGRLEDELEYAAPRWGDTMLRLSPAEISKLQRIAQAQERMLSRMYRASDPAREDKSVASHNAG